MRHGRDTNRMTHIVGKDHKGAAIRTQNTADGNAVHDGAHTMFAYAVTDVAAGAVILLEIRRFLEMRVV